MRFRTILSSNNIHGHLLKEELATHNVGKYLQHLTMSVYIWVRDFMDFVLSYMPLRISCVFFLI